MMKLQQCYQQIQELCQAKWGVDWKKHTSLDVSLRLYFVRGFEKKESQFYFQAYAIGNEHHYSVEARTTNDLVKEFRRVIRDRPVSIKQCCDACDDVLQETAAAN